MSTSLKASAMSANQQRIVAATGNYGAGLYLVGAHCIVAALLFLFVMGKIERIGEEQPA